MENQKYSRDELVRLVNDGQQHRVYIDGCLQDNLEPAKTYIDKYFFQTSKGEICFIDYKRQLEIVSMPTFRTVYSNKFPKQISKWFFTENSKIYDIVCSINAPTIDRENLKINCSGKFLHEYKPYADFDKSIHDKVNLFLTSVKENLCSNKQEIFDYLLKWTANMIQGNKNTSIIYLKSPFEGIGKSSYPKFIADHVIGRDLSVNSGASPLTTNFNYPLLGKLLVVFEELKLRDSDWASASAKLKTMVSEKYDSYEAKNQNAVQAENISNYIIPTNVDAIQHADGRRVFQLDLSTAKMGNDEYWKTIYDTCYNNTVGHAFFCFLKEINLSEFRSSNIPETQAKQDVKAKLLPIEQKFLKDEFVLKKKELKHTVADLYNLYRQYCLSQDKKASHLMDFNTRMRELQLEYKKTKGCNWYVYSYETLKEMSVKFKWIHELDIEETKAEVESSDDDDEDNVKPYDKHLENKLKSQSEEIAELKRQLELAKQEKTKTYIKLVLPKTNNIAIKNEMISNLQYFDKIAQDFAKPPKQIEMNIGDALDDLTSFLKFN